MKTVTTSPSPSSEPARRIHPDQTVKDSNHRSFRDGFTVPRLQACDQRKRLTRNNFRAYSPQTTVNSRRQPDAHDLGFAAEIWDWTTKDLDALAATGARFTSMTGYVAGNLTDPNGADTLLHTAEQSIRAAAKLGTPNLNPHGTGLDDRGLPVQPVQTVTGAMWRTAVKTLTRIAALGEREGVVFSLENLNTAVDHPGTPFARATDTRSLVQAVDSTHLRMNLDPYHAQIGEGNLIQLIRDSIDWIGEVQVADVPGRCEPGTVEINYPAIAAALHEAGYTGVVGLEAWASGDDYTALQRFRDASTPPAYPDHRPVHATARSRSMDWTTRAGFTTAPGQKLNATRPKSRGHPNGTR
jgi:hydroxypyruvate isomerase